MRRRGSGAGPVDARRHPDVAVCVLISSTIGLVTAEKFAAEVSCYFILYY